MEFDSFDGGEDVEYSAVSLEEISNISSTQGKFLNRTLWQGVTRTFLGY